MNIEQYFFVFDIELEFLYYTKTSYKLNFMAVEQIEKKKFRTKEIFWQGTPYIYLKGLVILWLVWQALAVMIDDLTLFSEIPLGQIGVTKHNLYCKCHLSVLAIL